MEWSDRGLVLAKGVFREYDVWLRILFRQHGVQTVFAFGGLHSRRRFVGCLDLLNVLECHVQEKGSYHCMTEALLLRGPGFLRTRPGRQGLAMNFVRLVDSAAVSAEQSPAVLQLMEESLDLLARDPLPEAMSVFFRLRLMAVLGYAPDFLHCCLCRRPLAGKSFFCVEEGGPMCDSCRTRFGGRRQNGAWLLYPTLQLLHMVRERDPLAWPMPRIVRDTVREHAREHALENSRQGLVQDTVLPASQPSVQLPGKPSLQAARGAGWNTAFDRQGQTGSVSSPAAFCDPAGPVCSPETADAAGASPGERLIGTVPETGQLQAPGAHWVLDAAQRRAASLCIDGMLAYHVGLAWERGRYVRT